MAVIVLLVAAPASASTVSVQETPGDTNRVLLTYRAGPGEENRLTMSAVAKGNGYWDLHVVDPGAVIAVGSGCSTGQEVTCAVHEPKGFDFGACSGHDCLPPMIPGSAWEVEMNVALGDGDDSFDGSAFTENYQESVLMTVGGGAGADRISTGGGEDRIDPGPGFDVVRSGTGFDRIQTTPDPDGPDVYESEGGIDKISYASRALPVELHGTASGAGGEGDQLLGQFHVIGGTANDVLVGAPDKDVLEGGPGNDVLVAGGPQGSDLFGGPGDDQLSSAAADAESINHLVGEEGDDSYYGGAGTDMMRDSEFHSDGASKPEYGPNPDPSGGNDIAFGAEGKDYIELRAGRDIAYGGPGDDGLHGGTGQDRLYGGTGDDYVIGGSGYDRLFGGSGGDELFSGWWNSNYANPSKSFPFSAVHNDGPDRVRCGDGKADRAYANPWDKLSSCETVHLRPGRHHQKR